MNKTFLAVVLILALAVAGCESMGPKATTGTLVGAGVGAVAGGVIGHQVGSGPIGAAIGATVGGLAGGMLGNKWDQQDKEALAVNPNHLTYSSIVNMAKEGLPDDAIISEIQRTHSVYNLTSEIIDYLKKNKVSDKVINYMLSTAQAVK